MKKMFGKLLLLAALLLPFPAATAEAALPEGQQMFTITDAKVNKETVKPGDKLKYSFTLRFHGLNAEAEKIYRETTGSSEDYEPWEDIEVIWKSSKNQKVVRKYRWEKGKSELKVEDSIPVQKGMQSGTWKISSFSVYLTEEYGYLGIYDEKKQGKWKDNGLRTFLDLSFSEFKVKGTGKADSKAPTIDLGSLKLSRNKISFRQTATFSVKVKDQCKIESVESFWSGAMGDFTEKMKYDKKSKSYQCKIKFFRAPYIKSGAKVNLDGIIVSDIYGNRKSYISWRSGAKYEEAFSRICIEKK